jgi:4-amino-4-deoxy-L-arabinose transferase-like glycosyltransferase
MSRTRRGHAIRILLILIGATVVYLVGNGHVPLWDRDEPRYAQTSRQMLRSGDWVVPRLLDEVRTAKPVLIYWCQASAMKLLGENEFAARLPSTVAMILTLLVLALVPWRSAGPHRAVWTVFILASSALAIVAAKLCITDAVLLLWIVIAELCLIAIYWSRSAWWAPYVMWVAIGLAGLTKGPVVLGVLLTTMLVLAIFDVGRDWRSGASWAGAIRWWRCTRPITGIIIVTLVCGPWLYLVERRAPGFLGASIWHDVITRARTGLEGHKGPPGYYLASIWLTYFPWSLLLPAALFHAWSRRGNPIHRFCLAAIIGPWVMFEVVQTKLVHYLLPVFPPLAFLTADMLIRAARRARRDLSSRRFLAVARTWAIAVALAGLLPWTAVRYFVIPTSAVIAMSLISALCAAYGALTFRAFDAHRPLRAAGVMGSGMLLVIGVMFGGLLPRAMFLRTSPAIASVLADNGAVDPGDAVMIDYKEDSLAFYQGGTIRRADAGVFDAPRADWPMWIVITTRAWDALSPSMRDEFDEVARVRGWWYVKGRVVEVLVLRKKSPFAGRAPSPFGRGLG